MMPFALLCILQAMVVADARHIQEMEHSNQTPNMTPVSSGEYGFVDDHMPPVLAEKFKKNKPPVVKPRRGWLWSYQSLPMCPIRIITVTTMSNMYHITCSRIVFVSWKPNYYHNGVPKCVHNIRARGCVWFKWVLIPNTTRFQSFAQYMHVVFVWLA